MTIAFVFPGQGAQTIGMGRALAEASPAARAVFESILWKPAIRWHVRRIEVPRSFADYAVSIDDAALPAGVSLQRRVG